MVNPVAFKFHLVLVTLFDSSSSHSLKPFPFPLPLPPPDLPTTITATNLPTNLPTITTGLGRWISGLAHYFAFLVLTQKSDQSEATIPGANRWWTANR